MAVLAADTKSWRAFDSNGLPVSGARLSVYSAGTTTPLTVYQDEALTTPHAHPIIADAAGAFPVIYVGAGLEAKVDIQDALGVSLPGFPVDNILTGEIIFATVADLLASTATGFLAGQTVRTRSEGYAYVVAASAATDHHVTTAGGVKLYIRDRVPTIGHWGAVGDFNGTTGANSTTAIDSALTWWAAGASRHLHIPQGWFYYSGAITLDLGARKWNKLTCDGEITLGGVDDTISWQITNHENSHIQLRLRNGGKLGNFSARTPVGGTTALKIHTARWCRVDIEAMNYKGRVVHFTAGGTDQATRCRMMDIKIKTGNRTIGGDDAYCGQPFFADSGSCDQTGAFGKIDWRGEGCAYGPVFQRLNDIDIGHIEAGKFTTTPLEFRGCVVAFASVLYIGATDVAGGANSENVRFVADPETGRLNGDIHIKTLRTLRSIDGVYATSFDPDLPGLRVGSYTGSAGAIGIVLEGIPSAVIAAAAVDDMTGIIDIRGACGNIDLNVDKVGAVTGDVVKVTGTVSRLRLSGQITGGAGAGFSLVNLGTSNNKVELTDLDLDSSTCDQLVNIGFAGANKVRVKGGSMTGSSAKFTSGRRPEYAAGVRGYQTESCGQATILSGTTSVTFSHGLDTTPQYAGLTGIGDEVASVYLTSITSTQITASVPTAVTADRNIYWLADARLVRGDIDA